MFDFLITIFNKIIAFIAGIIIATGLVSVPLPAEVPVDTSATQEVSETQKSASAVDEELQERETEKSKLKVEQLKTGQELQEQTDVQEAEGQGQSGEKINQGNALIKIELCKSEMEEQKSLAKSTVEKKVAQLMEPKLQEYKDDFNKCSSDADDTRNNLYETSNLLPSEISEIVGERINQCISVFNIDKESLVSYYESYESKWLDNVNRSIEQDYQRCLSQ